MTENRLNQLATRGYLPFETHVNGTRMYRRAQLVVVAQARDVKWLMGGYPGRIAP